MWHKPCRTFHPWCLCIKTRCLYILLIDHPFWHSPIIIASWGYFTTHFFVTSFLCSLRTIGIVGLPTVWHHSRNGIGTKCLVFWLLASHAGHLWVKIIHKAIWCEMIFTDYFFPCKLESLHVVSGSTEMKPFLCNFPILRLRSVRDPEERNPFSITPTSA